MASEMKLLETTEGKLDKQIARAVRRFKCSAQKECPGLRKK